MFNDLFLEKTEEWKPNAEQQQFLDDLKWQAILTFTLYLDTPEHENHCKQEALHYILLVLTVMQDIKEGDHPEDIDSIDTLEDQFEQWEYFYNTFDEYENKKRRSDLQKEVNDIFIEVSLKEGGEDGE